MYERQTWTDNSSTITAAKMNHIEEGIENAAPNIVLRNQYTNGNFSSVTPVEGNNTTRTIEDGILKVLASARYGWAGKTFSLTAGDTIYVSAKAKCAISSVRDVVITLARQSGSQEVVFRQWIEDNNVWKRYSGMAVVQETGSDFRFQVYDNRSSGFTEIDLDDMILINVTQAFGAGHIPTFEEIDSIIQWNAWNTSYPFTTMLKLYEANKAKLDKTTYYGELVTENYDFSTLTAKDIIYSMLPTSLYGVFTYSSGRATLKKLLKVSAGTRFKSAGTVSFLIFCYDSNMKLIVDPTGTSYLQDYTVEQDCFVRVVFSTNNVNTLRSTFSMDIPKNLVREERIDRGVILKNTHLANKFNCPQEVTFKSFGHQGNRGLGVGNTVPAVIGAKQGNFIGVEGDIRRNTYGEYFMYHSSNMLDSGVNWDGWAYDVNGYVIYKDNNSGVYYFYDEAHSQMYTFDYANQVYVPSEVQPSALTVMRYRLIVVNDEKVEFLKRVNSNYCYPYIDASKYTGMLTFKEWLLLCKKLGLKCMLDRKFDNPTLEIYTELYSIVKSVGMTQHVYWICGSTTIAEWVRSLQADAKIIYDFNESFPNISARSDVAAFHIPGVEDSLIVDARMGKVNGEYVMKETEVQSWVMAGITVGGWNYMFNTQTKEDMTEEINRLIDLGVSVFINDIWSPYDLMNDMYDIHEPSIINLIK